MPAQLVPSMQKLWACAAPMHQPAPQRHLLQPCMLAGSCKARQGPATHHKHPDLSVLLVQMRVVDLANAAAARRGEVEEAGGVREVRSEQAIACQVFRPAQLYRAPGEPAILSVGPAACSSHRYMPRLCPPSSPYLRPRYPAPGPACRYECPPSEHCTTPHTPEHDGLDPLPPLAVGQALAVGARVARHQRLAKPGRGEGASSWRPSSCL